MLCSNGVKYGIDVVNSISGKYTVKAWTLASSMFNDMLDLADTNAWSYIKLSTTAK